MEGLVDGSMDGLIDGSMEGSSVIRWGYGEFSGFC